MSQRAKIFSPFAALKGFEEAIDEKVQRYVEKRELNDEEQEALEAEWFGDDESKKTVQFQTGQVQT